MTIRGAIILTLFCVTVCSRGPSIDPRLIPDDSLYQLPSSWKNETGRQFALTELSGQVQIVGLIFTRCAAICPAIVTDMQKIERNVPWYRKKQIHFVLISIDPERDTPEVLAAYMKQRGLDPDRWTSLTGEKNTTNDLAALMGIKIQKLADGSLAHSKLLTVLNGKGQIKFQDMTVTENGANFVRAAVDAID